MGIDHFLEYSVPIIPTTKCLFLCDGYTPVQAGKITLHGLFHTIKTVGDFPFIKDEFCVYMELGNGLGRIPFHFEIRKTIDDTMIYESKKMELDFEDRTRVFQVAVRIKNCCFDQPGEFVLNLICNNSWIGDTVIRVE